MRCSTSEQTDSEIASKPGLKVLSRLVLLLLVLASVTVAAFRTKKPAPVPPAAVAPGVQQPSASQGSADHELKFVPVQLKPLGFVPREVRGTKGDYFFSVSNQSGVGEVSLRLEREQGERIHEITVKRERLRWRQRVHLTPGLYRLTEASHPDWECRILITPN